MTIDITGQRFGHLVAIEVGDPKIKKDGRKQKRWRCICDCGDEILAPTGALRFGQIVSCPKRHTIQKHGHTLGRKSSPTYNSYQSMKYRCLNPNMHHHHRYGGRGITICDRWLGDDGFAHFVEDMGERPSKKYTVERIDNDGDYCPENCKWATRAEQALNRSTGRTHIWNGVEYTLADLSKATGVSKERLRHRICRAGWSVEDAVTVKQSVQGIRPSGSR